jgi:AAA+ superfamily predicted ATPase
MAMEPKRLDDLLDDALSNSASATSYRIRRGLVALFPDKAVFETDEGEFDPWEYGTKGHCEIAPRDGVCSQLESGWGRHARGVWTIPGNACLAVRWNAHDLVVVKASWSQSAYQRVTRHWIVAESLKVAESFFLAVTEWCHAPKEEVLAFNGGCWTKSKELYASISNASFDDLILAGDLKNAIRQDFERFLASRTEYEAYRVPWKRGVLFVGPPGNGKTHCLRATVKFLNVPCLYVQSLQAKYETDDANILKVFKHARSLTPCCLVFEDLDSMITPENRSFFLNQLDGFSDNPGILTLATTNHPERLDPAILSRPSRFDRKYHFDLPALRERSAYIESWNRKFQPDMRLGDDEAKAVSDATEGFSFAYVKELFVSAMMAWMIEKRAGTMPRILDEQLAILREHMKSETSAAPAKAEPQGMERAVEAVMKRFF